MSEKTTTKPMVERISEDLKDLPNRIVETLFPEICCFVCQNENCLEPLTEDSYFCSHCWEDDSVTVPVLLCDLCGASYVLPKIQFQRLVKQRRHYECPSCACSHRDHFLHYMSETEYEVEEWQGIVREAKPYPWHILDREEKMWETLRSLLGLEPVSPVITLKEKIPSETTWDAQSLVMTRDPKWFRSLLTQLNVTVEQFELVNRKTLLQDEEANQQYGWDCSCWLHTEGGSTVPVNYTFASFINSYVGNMCGQLRLDWSIYIRDSPLWFTRINDYFLIFQVLTEEMDEIEVGEAGP